MFSRKNTAESDALNATITKLLDDMQNFDPDGEDYATCLNRFERLTKQREKLTPSRFNPDTLLIVGGNLLGIVIIVGYEHSHVIATKAIGFAGKLR